MIIVVNVSICFDRCLLKHTIDYIDSCFCQNRPDLVVMLLKYDYSYHECGYSSRPQYNLVENTENIWNLADYSNCLE